jgi:hypothetical protein
MYKKIIKNYIYLIYPIATLIYAMHLFISGIRTGICLTAVLLLGAACIAMLGLVTVKKTEDKVFTAYLIYNLLSGIWCVAYGMPVAVYAGEVTTTALPMVFYYAGRGFDEEEADRYYRGFVIAALAMGLLGAVMFIFTPQFYLDFAYENSLISVADAPTARVRMESVIGSGAMGCFVAYAMCISSFFLWKKNGAGRREGIIYMVLSIIFTFMANQRSAMFSVILMLIFFSFTAYKGGKKSNRKYIWIGIAGVIAVVAGIFVFARGVFDKFWARLSSIPAGFGERTGSWVNVVNRTHNFWLGDGLGSRGHRAAGFQEYIIADGGLVKLYSEMGIIGTSLILFILVLVYTKAYRNIRKVVPEIAVITCAILMSIGSNVLEIELCAPVVYFALGRAVRILTETDPAAENAGESEPAGSSATETGGTA